jgi:hypothetical protein
MIFNIIIYVTFKDYNKLLINKGFNFIIIYYLFNFILMSLKDLLLLIVLYNLRHTLSNITLLDLNSYLPLLILVLLLITSLIHNK